MNREEAKPIVLATSSLLQYKNSLKFVQGGTNMSLERMGYALDSMCVDVFMMGYEYAQSEKGKLTEEKLEGLNAKVQVEGLKAEIKEGQTAGQVHKSK